MLRGLLKRLVGSGTPSAKWIVDGSIALSSEAGARLSKRAPTMASRLEGKWVVQLSLVGLGEHAMGAGKVVRAPIDIDRVA